MKCPECGYTTTEDLERCARCQAEWKTDDSSAQESSPAQNSPSRSITESSEPPLKNDLGGAAGLEQRLDQGFDRLYDRLKNEEAPEHEIRWGGFGGAASLF